MSVIKLSKKDISYTPIDSIYEYIEWNPAFKDYMSRNAGQEHYKLLAYLTKQLAQINQFKGLPVNVSDLGTQHGCSALAFSCGHPTCMITTYDVINQIPANVKSINNIPNIKRKYMSCQLDMTNVAKSDIVLLDIEPNDGVEQAKVVQKLKDEGFKGILIIDDIHINQDMKMFWNNITMKKYDVTDLGHWSGTGIVVYDDDTLDIKILSI